MKRSRVVLKLFAVSLLLGVSQGAYAQSLDELNAQREAAEREIEKLDRELLQLESSTKDAQREYILCSQRLSKRNQVLRSTQQQIKLLNISQKEQSTQARQLTGQLEDMRESFLFTVRRFNAMKSVSGDAQLLLSDSLQGQYTSFSHYTKLMLADIKQSSSEIMEMQGVVGQELRDIAQRQAKLDILYAEAEVAVAQIKQEQDNIAALRRELGGRAQQLTQQKESWLQATAELQKQIAEIIAQELAAEQNRDEASEEMLSISSADFEKFKGRMSSPMAGAKIIDSYGLHNHPTQAGVKIDNKGVNLEGRVGGSVRAVASGEVRKVFVVAGLGASILVRHGQYITVYSNLSLVKVKVGDTVVSGTPLGDVGSDGMLHFELWNETKNEDPTKWVKF